MLKTYRTYYGFLWKYKLRFLVFVFCMVTLGILTSLDPYFYKLFVDNIPTSGSEDIAGRGFDALFRILVFYIGFRFVDLLFDVLTFVSGDWLMIPAGRDARIAVMRKIQELDFAYHLSKSTGSLISAIKRGDGAFFGLHHALNNQVARIVVNFIVVLFFFSRIHWEIALMMAITFAVVVFVMRYLIALSVRRRTVFNNAEDEISSIIVDNLINFETVKLFAKEEREITRLSRSFERWSSALWGHSNAFRTIDVTVGTIGSVSFFFILLFAIRGVSNLSFSTGDFVLIVGFLGTFYPKFFQIVYEFRNIAKQHADIERYFAILDSETLVKDPRKPVLLKEVAGEISFNKVTFSYPGTKRTSLRNFSLDVRQGQSVAFVGRSGVGKTTLVKLLMRFYDVDGGSIKIDGVDIRNFTKSQLRSFMGVVPQEPILFNDTIGFNIAYGADNPSKKQIEAAAKIARLEEFISHLPDGYNTYVGERGVKLSGGQKQRLAIARMILSNPKIIIFDEATSQLDSESERAIQDAFWEVSRDKTTIVIAHRLSTVVRADKIVVMERGKISETGSHRALLQKKNGLYRKFWDLQVDSFE